MILYLTDPHFLIFSLFSILILTTFFYKDKKKRHSSERGLKYCVLKQIISSLFFKFKKINAQDACIYIFENEFTSIIL